MQETASGHCKDYRERAPTGPSLMCRFLFADDRGIHMRMEAESAMILSVVLSSLFFFCSLQVALTIPSESLGCERMNAAGSEKMFPH